jgi:hypothetical protein
MITLPLVCVMLVMRHEQDLAQVAVLVSAKRWPVINHGKLLTSILHSMNSLTGEPSFQVLPVSPHGSAGFMQDDQVFNCDL